MNLVSPVLRKTMLDGRRSWLVTGAAGFIGSNLVEALLDCGQDVVGLDNFSTGYRSNLQDAEASGTRRPGHGNFRFVEGDIRDRNICADAVRDVDHVLHHAALGSVPMSIDDPIASHEVNLTGFINLLDASRQAGVKRFIYAASSAVYGDADRLPNIEDQSPDPLSPYAATKLANEIYAAVYARSFGFKATGLRYFNIFGPRQDPNGAYSAVIPRWIAAMISDSPITIYGNGETTRDFCFIANVVQANFLAALAADEVQGQVFNIALGHKTSLLELFEIIKDGLSKHQIQYVLPPSFDSFRPGDILHSEADVSKAKKMIGYDPPYSVADGIAAAIPWYLSQN
jgi:UDP-N-acetylglucosamine 4-epimerase